MRGAELFSNYVKSVMTVIFAFFEFFELIKTVMEKLSRGILFWYYRFRFCSFLNRHHHTTANASTATNNKTKTTHTITYSHMLTHAHTTKHNKTQTNTNKHKHFQVARGLHSKMIRTCSAKQGMSQSTGTLTLRQVRAVCTQREPDWTSDHCHCC